MGALDHIRVLEYGAEITAPFCSRLFADFGAEVIKLEPPGGDRGRQRGPFAACGDGHTMSGFFHYLNAGKSSMVVDLDDADDRKLLDQLLSGTDIFIENLPGHQRTSWQLDYESLTGKFPHLIVVSISAFGRTGPWKDRKGTDITIQAASSLSVVIGGKGLTPLRIPFDQAEFQSALHAAGAALSALFERGHSGLGQGVDIAAADILTHQVGAMHLLNKKAGSQWDRAQTFPKRGNFPTGFYQCADGYLSVTSTQPKYWQNYLKLMGDPAWAQDEKQRDDKFLAQTDSLEPAHVHFREWLLKYTRAELSQLATENDILLCAVNKPGEVYESDQFAFRKVWSEVSLGDNRARFAKPGYVLSETPTLVRSPGPDLNADGERIRANPWLPVIMPRTDAERQQGALAGVRILDFGWNWAGPMAGEMLSDMGAEVIRIETHERLDNMRTDSYSHFFCHSNRNKLSATFNVKSEEGSRLLKVLVETSDVVMDNFAAGVMARNGLSYEDLSAVNPGVIVMSMSMAGEYGPARGMRGYASLATAYAGLEGLVGYPDTGKVTGFIGFGLGDTNMSIQGTIAVLAALVYRQHTGKGQFIDVSQIESSTATLGEMLMGYTLSKTSPGIQGNEHPEYGPHNFYATRGEEQWLALSVTNDVEWQGLCRAIRREDLLQRDDLKSQRDRRERTHELDAIIGDWCRDQDRDEVIAILDEEDVPCAPLFAAKERDAHPAFAQRNTMHHHESIHFEDCDIYHTGWNLSATPPLITRSAPAVGEHNDYVFLEMMGLEPSYVARLIDEGILD